MSATQRSQEWQAGRLTQQNAAATAIYSTCEAKQRRENGDRVLSSCMCVLASSHCTHCPGQQCMIETPGTAQGKAQRQEELRSATR